MQLTDEQKKAVTQWVAEGAGLSDLQRRLADEFKLTLTYIDVRFLVIDLGLSLKEQQKKVSDIPKDLSAPPPLPEADPAAFEPEPALGGVDVELDRITRPGTLVSGTVVFSDGVKAHWALDQMGRLSLGADKKDYRPSADDVQAFQQALTRELKKAGYA
jgi:hypothetical protein